MKAIPLGLISSIIFSIVLAENSSDSKFSTGCFPFCIKKTKKDRKMTYEPIKSKDEYDPDLPNLKFIDKFTPITLDIYKRDQTVLNEPFISETDGAIVDEVTGFLRRENDSRRQGYYIKPYEEDYEHMIKINFMPLNKNDQSFQSNQTNVHKQSGTPPATPKAAEKQEFPKEQKLSTINEEDSNALDEDKENDENENDEYNEVINMLWDPDLAKFFDVGFVKRKFARVYNPNIVIMQQRCKYWCMGRQEYFYALAAKAQKSENKTIIVMTSANINDHNPSKKKYQNRIIENANLFKTDIDSEDDIRKGKLKKTFVNIAGYLIQKKNTHIYITYVESIDGRPTI
ncbi:fam-a protein [Plasmodium vinckei petteri]|uniref:Fam-a protein n=1 Tax=Plasmodium vinckei petteri TaxID=138298 RepID=A0A6V7SI71_PLAVN|nr:fam-a protein [Plasmodium vinckei petteri]